MLSYDLVVIGSGPAGEKAAVQAARYGHSVCVIDRSPAGGAWVNNGTIPSKTLRESALYLAGGRRRGVMMDPSATPTVRSFMAMKRHLVARWRDKVEQNFRSHQVARMYGTARFVDPHTLEVDDGTHVRGRYILIATGSRPRQVDSLPVDGRLVHDSDSILSLERIPASMIVLGGGVIACEYASIFQALGVQVTLINGRDRILGFLDREVTDFLEATFRDNGMVIRHQARPRRVDHSNPGDLELYLDDGTIASAEVIFVALGRTPVTEDLNLEAAGVQLTSWHTVEVNDHQQSNVPHIYAAGDVVGFPSLASAGMEQGRVAAAHMFGVERGGLAELIPAGVFTIPEVSSVGMDAEQAAEQGFEPVTGSASYSQAVRAAMIGDDVGLVKLVADRATGRLLGATIAGNQATELIHFAQAVIRYQGTVQDLNEFVFNLPSLSVMYKQAAYRVMEQMGQA
jgi:NAD(P) transhydrogenase